MDGDVDSHTQERIDLKRLRALTHQQEQPGGLELPNVSRTCIVPAMPKPPTNFLLDTIPEVTASVLKNLNARPLDASLTFISSTHTYLINDTPTLGSVAGLVHRFASVFDADAIIPKMVNGSRWPRPGYLQMPPPAGIIQQLSKHEPALDLFDKLTQHPCDESAICAEAIRLCSDSPCLSELVFALAMTTEQIKLKWEHNRVEAANQGTFMHLTFELYLNCAPITFYSVELEFLCSIFLRCIS